MNNHSHIKKLFKLLFDIRKINISFYSKTEEILIDHIPRDNHRILPLNAPDRLHFEKTNEVVKLIYPNEAETYLLVPCSTTLINGIFIWGPFSLNSNVKYSVKDIMRSLNLPPNQYDFVESHLSCIPFLPHDELNLLKSNTLGLASLSPEDIECNILNKPKFKIASPPSVITKEESLINIWQNSIAYTDLKESQKFFRDLFSCKDYDESIHVLQSYVHISKPFDYISLDKYSDHVESLRSVLLIILGITITNATLRGMDNYTNMGLSLDFGLKINSCSTIDELITIRNKLFLSYSKEFYRSNHNNYSKLTKDIMSFIKDNIRKNLKVNDIALALDYAPSYLSNYFKKETGMGIKAFILTEKISLAKELLDRSDISISDLSDYLSFSSYNHFSSQFKRHTGLSPVEYRNSLHAKD